MLKMVEYFKWPFDEFRSTLPQEVYINKPL